MNAFAQAPDQRFCIASAKNGAAGDGPAGETWQLTTNVFHIPGLSAPVFTPSAGFHRPWTVDKEHRLVPYTGPFPNSYLDTGNWAREPWSGRVVAFTYGGGLSALAPGDDHFEKISVGADWAKPISSMAVLSRRRQTIVIQNDRALVVDGGGLQPWLSSGELVAHGIRGIRQLYDSPFLSATIIRDTDDNLHVLTDDDQWRDIGSVKGSWTGYLVDAPTSGVALLFAEHSELAIRRASAQPTVSFAVQTIASESEGAGQDIHVSKVFGQVLAYRSRLLGSPRWQRLTSEGFIDIPGGQFQIAHDKYFAFGSYVHDLPTLGRTLIEGADRLYLYDGATIEPVRDGEHDKYGEGLPSVYDLPSIGRVLIVTRMGIFEVTRDGAMVARPMPFSTADIFPQPVFSDWPKGGVALVATKSGVFAVDRDLKASPILGGDQIDLIGTDFAHGEMAGSGDLILSGHRGIFFAVNAQDAGAAICRSEQQLRQAIADSNLCLRGIPGSTESSIGFAIGGLAEAPVNNGLLLDTNLGLFLQRKDGSFVNLQPRTGQYTRSLVRLPWSDDVMIAGFGSAVVRDDLSLDRLDRDGILKGIFRSIQGALIVTGGDEGPAWLLRLENGRYRLQETKLKEVQATLDAPWFGGALVWTRSGLFLLSADGNAVPFEVSNANPPSPIGLSLSGASYSRILFDVDDFFAIDRFKTAYVRLQHGGWFRITPDREWLPVRGLPNELVLAHFDSGSGEALFGTRHGIFAVNGDGDARRLDGAGYPSQIVRAFTSSGSSIIAGGNEGLFEIRKDLSDSAPVANGSVASIGAVADIFDSGFAGFDIVAASNGTYAFENGSLKRIRDLSAAGRASEPWIFPGLRRILVTKSAESQSLLFEFGRYAGGGQCTGAMVDQR
jgi:hypothetical protein